MSICHNIKDVTYIDNSAYSGYGLFSLINLDVDTILFGSNSTDRFIPDLSSMNDADFIYPKTWLYEELITNFKLFEISNKCNSKVL